MFIDSPVQGLHYQATPSGLSGSTSANGEYQYAIGDTVIFSIGNLLFPSVTAKGIVTPLDLANTSDITNHIAVNIAALLQSLDTDGDPENGINIDYTLASANASALNFDAPYTTFAALPGVINLVANSGSSTKTLIAENAVSTHLQTSISKLNNAPLIGAWALTSTDNFKYVLLILDTSHYATLTYEGGATIEKGTYEWNKTTGILNVSKSVIAGTTPITIPFTTGNSLSIDGNTLTLQGSSSTTALSKLSSASNSLIGGWVLGSSIIVYADSYYFQGKTGPSDHAGQAGAEYGTYTRSGTSIVYKTLADTNGQWGLSHPCNIVESHKSQAPNDLSCLIGTGLKSSVTVSGDTMDIYVATNVLANQTNDINPHEPEHVYPQRVVQHNVDVLGSSNPLSGIWQRGFDSIIISNPNIFTHIKTGSLDPNCKAGTATGSFTWDALTSNFALSLLFDSTAVEDGDSCSLSDFNKLLFNGNSIVLGDGANEGTDKFTFTKVISKANGIVGSWRINNNQGTIILTFTDTNYFLSNIDNTDDGDGVITGSETGTYTFSGGNLTVNVTTNTDGSGGLSNFNQIPFPAQVSGDTLTLHTTGDTVFKRLQ